MAAIDSFVSILGSQSVELFRKDLGGYGLVGEGVSLGMGVEVSRLPAKLASSPAPSPTFQDISFQLLL